MGSDNILLSRKIYISPFKHEQTGLQGSAQACQPITGYAFAVPRDGFLGPYMQTYLTAGPSTAACLRSPPLVFSLILL